MEDHKGMFSCEQIWGCKIRSFVSAAVTETETEREGKSRGGEAGGGGRKEGCKIILGSNKFKRLKVSVAIR